MSKSAGTVFSQQARDEAGLFPRGLVPQRRERWPALEILSANRRNMDKFVACSWANIGPSRTG